MTDPLVKLDARDIVVRSRLWRRSDPRLTSDRHHAVVADLMAARMAVDTAKMALGERRPARWTDGRPDPTRRMAHNTVYGAWYAGEAPIP